MKAKLNWKGRNVRIEGSSSFLRTEKNSERQQNLKTGHLIKNRTRIMNMKLVINVKRQKMNAEWKNLKRFLMKTDKTEKPNKGIIMMMENLSTSSSTIGMVQ